MVAPEFGGDNRKRDDRSEFDKPLIGFPAHWAPLQMCLYTGTQFPEKYRGGMFLAFHGSWNRAPRPQAGYKVVFISFDAQGMPKGGYEEFATGFPGIEYFTSPRDAQYRPCGCTLGPDGSLYIGETEKGCIWRVIYTGESAPAMTRNVLAVAAGQNYAPIALNTPGGKIYAQVCAACHVPNGSGVPSMQPALPGNPVLAGDTSLLINILLKGPAATLPPNREKFGGAMPPFAVYQDTEIASVINYLRANFATNAPQVTAEEVAAQRVGLKN
jgi:mono/diheme cytochrome c family protein